MKTPLIMIMSAKRTPMGAFMGELSAKSAPELGATAIKGVLQPFASQTIDEVLMGCVLTAGVKQAPARQAALHAGLPISTGATTLNKVCGSGMKAIMMGHDMILAGSASTIVAGGMESMTNAPYLIERARAGLRMGHQNIKDHMFLDGLENAYDGQAMGCFADDTAIDEGISREDMDDFALASLTRAQKAQQSGAFNDEIVPVSIDYRGQITTVADDEGPKRANADKIPKLRPAFRPQGAVTAANASSISDGAAALLLMNEPCAQRQQLEPMAYLVGHTTVALAPEAFTLAPVSAITLLLDRLNWSKDSVDLFEINEAFAMVTLAAIKRLKLDPEKVNVHGGACALGHPIGASGARVVVTLIHALKQRGLKRGIASVCIGGGEATAIAVEVI